MPYKDLAKKRAYEKVWRDSHKEQTARYQKSWRQRNPEKVAEYNRSPRNFHLRRRYGIGAADRQTLLDSQNGGCALCKRTDKKLTIDHDHETEKLRGLLCYSCNMGLGLFKDSPWLLQEAIAYLERNKA